MSTQHPGSATTQTLPVLSDERVDEIERGLFAEIARDRAQQRARRTRRGRFWIAGGAAAAVVAVAAVIAPSVGSIVTGSAGGSSAVAPAAPAEDSGGGADSGVTLDSSESGRALVEGDMADEAMTEDADGARDIVTTASATVSVADVKRATEAISDSAIAHGGYVESMSVGTDGTVYPVDPMSGVVTDDMMPAPGGRNTAWVTVRVPSDELAAVIDELAATGEVTATSVDRHDVTEQTVDVEARIDAAQTSVDRLTQLMAQTQSVSDLIAAEAALSERQALLESYQQQLEMLQTQVAMSTLSVSVIPDVETVEADPAGFTDGLVAGWNGLVAALNGIVVALGFLLPWLVLAGIAAVIVWGVVRVSRRRRARRTDATTSVAASTSRAESGRQTEDQQVER